MGEEVLYHGITIEVEEELDAFVEVEGGFVDEMQEQQIATKQFLVCLMQVKLEGWSRGRWKLVDVAKGFE